MGRDYKARILFQWIDHIEGKNPSLRGKPFDTYMQNRQRLAKLEST